DSSVGTDSFTGVNSVQGSNFGDTLTGGSGNDFLSGNGGNDTIAGGGGNDNLTGGFGADTFVYATGGGADFINDFNHGQGDWIDGGNGVDRVVLSDATGSVTVNLAAGTASGAGVGSDTLISIEGAVGGDFADTFDASGFAGSTAQPGSSAGQSAFEGRGGDD